MAIAHPYSPGASSTPSDIGSTWAIASAPASAAARARSGAGSRQPRKFGCWKNTAAASAAASATRCGVGRAARVRHLDDLEPEAGRVRLHDLPHLGIERLREDDLRPVGNGVLRDEARVCGDRAAVVAGRVRHVHPGQLADHGLVLEDRLQHALAHLRLVRRVGGQELAAREHDVGDGRDVVVVDARAEERELRARVDVPRGELLDVARELGLAERGREVERAVEAHGRRDLLEELLHRGHPDRREHLLAVGVGQRQVAHCAAPGRAVSGGGAGEPAGSPAHSRKKGARGGNMVSPTNGASRRRATFTGRRRARGTPRRP